MTRPFFLYFILKAFSLTLLPSYMISIFKSVILSGGTFFNAFSHSLSFAPERTSFILFPYCEFYSRRGFNTPTLCVVIKGIKARLQPPYENNIPRRSASGLLIMTSFSPICLEALDPIQIPCRSVRFSQACIRLCSIYVP